MNFLIFHPRHWLFLILIYVVKNKVNNNSSQLVNLYSIKVNKISQKKITIMNLPLYIGLSSIRCILTIIITQIKYFSLTLCNCMIMKLQFFNIIFLF